MKIKHLFTILTIVSLACGGSREVISTTQPENQPTPTTSSNQETQPTAVTQQETVLKADVIDIYWYTTGSSHNTLHFVGTIQNSGTVDLRFTEIVINLKDDTGTLVGTASALSSLEVIKVGETSPFYVWLLDSPPNWTKYEVLVEGEETSYQPYRDFEVVSSQVTVLDSGLNEIVGEIKNIGSQDAEYVNLFVVYYDATGKIVGVNYYTPIGLDTVVAGGTFPFQAFADSPAERTIDRFEFFIEGRPSN